MRKAPILKVAVLTSLLSGALCFPQAANGKSAESAQRFIQGLYASYGPSSAPPNLFEKNASQAFDPSLVLLAKKDAAAVGQGSVGALDYDPVCNCQDTDVTFPDLKILIQSLDTSHATATVTFLGDDHEPNKIVLTLLRKKGQWRVFNIEDFTGPGPHADLRTMLKRDIRNLSREHGRSKMK